jgi:selenide,water dikinase
LPPDGIAQVLRNIPRVKDPNLLVGTETHDDAGVYQLTEEIAIVQTIDFFPPVVNDPFIYGQIAASNALSDVYAMGGVPKTALNLVGYPDDKLSLDWLGEILRGGADRCQASGTLIVGGHTIRDAEIKFGMAVTGIVHPRKIWTNASARPGDKLVLTKALGTGFVTTASKANDCPEETLRIACDSMVQLNLLAKDAAEEVGGVHAATDVTGFGLAGHLFEMAAGSGHTVVLELGRLPLIPGVEALIQKGYRTRASRTNREYVAASLQTEGTPDPNRLEVFYDAQTSGGMVLSVEPSKADALVEAAKKRGAPRTCVIGEIAERTRPEIGLILKA